VSFGKLFQSLGILFQSQIVSLAFPTTLRGISPDGQVRHSPDINISRTSVFGCIGVGEVESFGGFLGDARVYWVTVITAKGWQSESWRVRDRKHGLRKLKKVSIMN
jgi:hypothetical protein